MLHGWWFAGLGSWSLQGNGDTIATMRVCLFFLTWLLSMRSLIFCMSVSGLTRRYNVAWRAASRIVPIRDYSFWKPLARKETKNEHGKDRSAWNVGEAEAEVAKWLEKELHKVKCDGRRVRANNGSQGYREMPRKRYERDGDVKKQPDSRKSEKWRIKISREGGGEASMKCNRKIRK
jgi:hypothetical protein